MCVATHAVVTKNMWSCMLAITVVSLTAAVAVAVLLYFQDKVECASSK